MKETAKILLVCFFVIATMIPNICLADKINKAAKLVEKGIKLERVKMRGEAEKLYYKADKLIKEAIIDDPNNPDLHFRAGIVYLNMGKTWDANQRFEAACNVLHCKKYCRKIAKIYQELTILKLQAGKTRDAKYCYQLALKFNPSLRVSATRDLFRIGDDYLRRGVESIAYRYFKLASQFSGSIKTEITKSYLKVIKRAKGRTKIFLCLRALEFDKGNYLNELIKIIGDEVKKIDPTTEERERYEAYVLSHNLIPRDRVKEAFYADYRVLKFGIHSFKLKKGESTPYLVVPKDHKITRIDTDNDDLLFVLILKERNGNVSYNIWETKKWVIKDSSPVKAISMRDQRLDFVVSKWDWKQHKWVIPVK